MPLDMLDRLCFDPGTRTLGELIGLGHSSIYNYVAAGTFPAPIKVGENSVRWKLADILAWRARISDAGAPAERKESGAARSRRP
jgi:predicted DNA-binding transcriptional regulator AlpA